MMTLLKIRWTLMCLLLIGMTGVLQSQMMDKLDKQSGSASGSIQELLKMQSPVRGSVLDGPVDPKLYIVGPGDIFSVSVWSGVPLSMSATVTPEGTVIVPTVGEFDIAGKNLDDAKRMVIGEIRKKYSQQQITFTLAMPRSFTVVVKGNVLSEGKYVVQATDRADVAIAMANTLPMSTTENDKDNHRQRERDRLIEDMSVRRIELVHRDGTRSTVDLERFYIIQNAEYNPYLRDGDLIIVPKKDVLRNYISVFGAVNKEGVFEYCDGDRLSMALAFARGLTPLADTERITVIRSNPNGTKDGVYSSTLEDTRKAGDLLLQRGDQIVVGTKLELRRNNRVYVEGEVNSPGYYPITKDSTLLSTVIAQANGLTASASLKTSRLYRKTVNEKDIQDERLESARGGYTPDDSSYYFLETNIRINREQVPLDFEALINGHQSSQDVYLQNGDIISIGSRVKTIYIFGQVVKPGHYTYVPGKDFEAYIAEAGGYTSESRESDLRIIKANTRQWLKPSETSVEEGDYIWVPKDIYHPGGYYLQLTSQVFGILGAVGTLVLLVFQITK